MESISPGVGKIRACRAHAKTESSSKDLFGNKVVWEGKTWKERLTSADPEKNINAWGVIPAPSELPQVPVLSLLMEDGQGQSTLFPRLAVQIFISSPY